MSQMTSQPAQKSAAIVTIHDAADMTKRERTQVADWLRRCADSLEEMGHDYSKRFTARRFL